MRRGEWKILNGDVSARGGIQEYGPLFLDAFQELFPELRLQSDLITVLGDKLQFELRRRSIPRIYCPYIVSIAPAFEVNEVTAECRLRPDHYKVHIHDGSYALPIRLVVRKLKIRK